jgi:hypothetical protein
MLSMHIVLYLFLGLGQTLAHSHPETDHEVEVQRTLQAAAYHVSLGQTAFMLIYILMFA